MHPLSARTTRIAVLGVAVGAVALCAIVARLPGWNPETLWDNDVVVGSLIRADLYSMVTVPVHFAPGLFVVWRGFYELFPDPEWSLQILPFACGIAVIPVMAVLGQRLTGDAALGALAAAVTAVNPLVARYTVEVHHYTVECLLTALFLVAATGLHTPDGGIDRRRFGRVAIYGGGAAFLSAASLFVSFTIVHLGAIFAVVSRRRHPHAARTVLWWTVAYDLIVAVAILVLRGRTNDVVRSDFAAGFMPSDSIRSAWDFLAVRGRQVLEMSMPNWTGETPPWPLLFIGLGLIWLVVRTRTRFLGLVAAGIYAAVVVGSGLMLYPLGIVRTDIFTFPVGILLFTAGVWGVTVALPRPSWVRLPAAAVAISLAVAYPAPASYPQRNDVHLVNHLSAHSYPYDSIMLSFSAGYLAAFYGPWDVTPVLYETSTGFVSTIDRNNVLHLPLRLDYGDPNSDGARADAEHRRIVRDFLADHRPGRIWFLGYFAETFHGRKWAPNVLDVPHGAWVSRREADADLTRRALPRNAEGCVNNSPTWKHRRMVRNFPRGTTTCTDLVAGLARQYI